MGVNGENTLPDGWDVVPFGEVADFRNGLTYSAQDVGEGMKIIGVGDFQDSFTIRYDNLQRVRGFDSTPLNDLLRDGDLLFVRSNGNRDLIGRVLFIQRVQERLGHSGFTIRARVRDSKLLPRFAAHFFTSSVAKREFKLLGSGTNISNLNQGILGAVQVPLPSLQEQAAITQILDLWYAGIDRITALIDAKLRLRAALLSSLVTGKRQLSEHGFNGNLEAGSLDVDTLAGNGLFDVLRASGEKSYLPGIPKLGPLPSGWREVAFRDVLEVVERPVALEDDRTYQLVTAKRGRGGIVPRETLLGRQILTKTQFRVATGDFLISRRQIIHGACGVVPSSLDGAVVSNEYATLRVKDGLLLDYLRYLSHSDYFQMTCFHASVGVAIEKMVFRLEEWLNHKFHLPPEAEQRRIASCVGWLEHEIVLLSKQRDAVTKQKRGLMQLLLTGKLRVRTQ